MDENTWRRYTAVPLTVASVIYLAVYSWRVITEANGPYAWVANAVVYLMWALFVADYLVRLSIAPKKWLWFRTHLADLVITLIPVLRLVRLLRVFTELPGIRRTRAGALRNRLAVYSVGSVIVLIYISALQVLDVERTAPGATIVSFGDAIWWACVTATTTGFGDFTPVTVPGRVVGVALMFGGVALTGVITAIFASWVMERASRNRAAEEHDDSGDAATRGQIRELQAQLAALAAHLPAVPAQQTPDPGSPEPGSPDPGR